VKSTKTLDTVDAPLIVPLLEPPSHLISSVPFKVPAPEVAVKVAPVAALPELLRNSGGAADADAAMTPRASTATSATPMTVMRFI
jgi:hypothetical protein